MDIGPAKAPLHAEQTVVSRSVPLRAREHDAPTGHVVAQPTAHAAITAQRADLGERALSPWRWRVSYCQRIGWADALSCMGPSAPKPMCASSPRPKTPMAETPFSRSQARTHRQQRMQASWSNANEWIGFV